MQGCNFRGGKNDALWWTLQTPVVCPRPQSMYCDDVDTNWVEEECRDFEVRVWHLRLGQRIWERLWTGTFGPDG